MRCVRLLQPYQTSPARHNCMGIMMHQYQQQQQQQQIASATNVPAYDDDRCQRHLGLATVAQYDAFQQRGAVFSRDKCAQIISAHTTSHIKPIHVQRIHCKRGGLQERRVR